MENLKKIPAILVAALIATAATQVASAQSLDFSDGAGDFTIGATAGPDGTATLDTTSPYYVADLQTALAALFPKGAPAIFNSYTTGQSGFILSNSAGTAVIASSGATLADPFVSYSTSFANTSGSGGSFSETFNSTFAPTTLDPDEVRASFGVTLTDGTADGSGVSETSTQTATLTYTTGGTVSAGVDLSNPLSADNGNSISNTVRTAGYPGYVTGPSGNFDQLSVTVSGSYTSGAQIGVSGRVDAIPEPSTWALMFAGFATLCLVSYRRARSL